ncbi:hypothetical protein [Mucilaginibacter myungsuensis]|uniref:Uncharacterized protein n=1 Tax=Mucilaginibacter myungsuensis TaxID=649104 RepID=A0A929KY47_9SPHI|nr:hypothetical protein [Mucilaginibacter myungsuensis]MBE9663312.1 hypothetical protein [Mucilaginibacter myungsuensis]MDN3600047.1 hypothetical protein [Mucilaginibacter myungsuensis]
MALPIELIIDDYRKKGTRKLKNGKRESKSLRVTFWDAFIVIVPVTLLLIGIFTNNIEEQHLSFNILSIGLSMLICTQYFNRITITKINIALSCICALLAISAYLLEFGFAHVRLLYGNREVRHLYVPMIVYVYIWTAMLIIKLITGVYPIFTSHRYRHEIYAIYNRKATLWDSLWTILNVAPIPLVLMIATDALI